MTDKDKLLWEAMTALAHTIRTLHDCSEASNYGDAIVVLVKLEEYFGVNKND